MKNSTIQGNTRKKGLTVPYRTLLSLTEFLVFGSVLFINDVITFQEQGGAVQKMMTQRQLRYIEWKGVKIYDFQKVTFSNFFKLYIAGLGVLIPKRYHMLGVGP